MAKVKELTPVTDGYSLLRQKAATLEVFRMLKGAPQPRVLQVSLPYNCAGEIAVGNNYVFNLANEKGLEARHWSRIDGDYQPWTNEDLAGLESVIAGVHQPMLEGTVSLPNGSPFPGVKVIAKGGGRSVTQTTDTDGRYLFTMLPDGEYTVLAEYPEGYGPADNYQTPRDKDERWLSIQYRKEWPCGTRMDFFTALSASVTGTIQLSAPPAGPYPYFSLVDVRTLNDSFPTALDSYSYPSEGGGPVGFKFFHVPPGRYVLKVGFDRSSEKLWTFYYPGVRSAREAKVIEVGLGTRTELVMRPISIDTISISGRMKLADGTGLNGSVMLVDDEAREVSDSFSPADRSRDDFSFKAPKGRKYYLCAGYDGVKDGRQIHLLKKFAINGTESLDDLQLVLDTPIRKGMYWWDQCRMMP